MCQLNVSIYYYHTEQHCIIQYSSWFINSSTVYPYKDLCFVSNSLIKSEQSFHLLGLSCVDFLTRLTLDELSQALLAPSRGCKGACSG